VVRGLLDEADDFPVLNLEHALPRRHVPRHHPHGEHAVDARLLCSLDRRRQRLAEHVVPVHDQKPGVDVWRRVQHGVSQSQLLAVVNVRDRDVPKRVPEAVDDLRALVPDHDDEFVDAGARLLTDIHGGHPSQRFT